MSAASSVGVGAEPGSAGSTGGAGARGITSVTDADGNPIDVAQASAGRSAKGPAASPRPAVVHRGQAWWPFRTTLPPYTEVGQRAEKLSKEQIVVNATATIDVRDVAKSLAKAPPELLLHPGSQRAALGYYLVKLEGFTRTQEQIDALTSAGATLGEYLNVNTYVAKIPAVRYAAVAALPFVAFIGDYHPAYKISPRIGLEDVPIDEAFDPVTGAEKPWLLELTLHKGADVAEALHALGQLAIFPQAGDVVSSDALTVILVRVPPERITAIAMIPGVKWIAEKAYPRLHASSTNPAAFPMILQNNGVYVTNGVVGWSLWNAGLDGSATGQIVTVMDSGLNTKMEHFAQDAITNGTVGPSHRKVVGYDTFGGGDQCVFDNGASPDFGHGAKTAQYAVGSISDMTTHPDTSHTPNVNWDDGVARGGKVYFQDIGTSAGAISPPLDLGPSITAAIAHGSFIQNDSWGAATNSYDTEAVNLDAALFANPNVVVTVSAGNRGAAGAGTLGSPATAKNAIAVGGNDAANPDNAYINCNWDGTATCSGTTDLGSSRGPVSGALRTKPDIMGYIWASVAVGGEQMAADRPTAMCQSDATKNVYMDYGNINEGGTSFAAPQIAGLAAIARDYFLSGFYPSGAPAPADALTPSGSLVKAMILASAEAMAPTAYPSSIALNPRYSSDMGYGRANLPAALHIGPGAPFLWIQNNDTLGQAATKSFNYTLNGNATPLRVMLVYYDAAGDALQKDADLKVTVAGTAYWGNNFNGGWSTSATSARDHTNNTEGVFLDAGHGLPASGSIQVDVIGYNDPGGMTYSLVVIGDVASAAVPQVAMDQGRYNCNANVVITVNDQAATSPVSVTLESKNVAATTIDTKVVSCAGTGGVFTGTIQTGSGIAVADGGTLTATYAPAADPARSSISCQLAAADAGFQIAGGCDNAAAGSDSISSPLANGGANEYYAKYMDGGEYSDYTFMFKNTTGVPLHDVSVALSFSGAAAAKMTAFRNSVHIGDIPTDAIAGAVFPLYTDPTAAPLSSVNLDFDVTSSADGYTAPKRLTQAQLLQTDNVVTRLSSCATFNTSLAPFAESTAVSGRVQNTWRWSGSATTPSIVGSELRTDGACGSATPNAAAMVGNSGTAANYVNNADSFLYTTFQPSLRGNAPSGQPYHYVWKWHSFYHASETTGNQDGVWAPFYDDQWNSAAAPTGDQLAAFPIHFDPPYFYQSLFDYSSGGSTTWNWDAANGGTPDDPHLSPSTGGAPNQFIITFTDSTTGLAASNTWFAYGHEHLDVFFLNGTTHGTHRDIALDNDRLVYDEYYASGQAGASCGAGGMVGQIGFDQLAYANCPTQSAGLTLLDANGVSGMQATVTSPGTGDSEVVTLTGSAPYFTATLALSTVSGVGANNGTLFVLPNETISVSYTDASPAGSSTASATIACSGGAIVYVGNTQVSDNGDNDSLADNNETVTIDVTVRNNLAVPLTNAKVTIFSASPNVDCVTDPSALYGTIGAGASATNPPGDRFTFHVASTVACANPATPPLARFIVVMTGDGYDGSATLQSFTIPLDLDPTASGGTYSYTQTFDTDPSWLTDATPDDSQTCSGYSNSFHWCPACGSGGGGYGAWIGNAAFGTSGQNYPVLDSSTLYSPRFVANGNVGMQFSLAYRTEPTYDGAIVQYQLDNAAWTNLSFTTPAQAATTSSEFCSPLLASTTAWTGAGTTWTTTNAATVPAAAGQAIQFRWRLGSDQSITGSSYGGLGVDNVSITNLKLTVACETTRNPGLPACPFCAVNPNGTPCDDGNACTASDACSGGACAGTPVTVPAEIQNVAAASDKTTFNWSASTFATRYDVLRGSLSAFPVGPGGADEICFNDLPGTSVSDTTVPAAGSGYWYVSRGENTCAGNGTFGTQTGGAPRTSGTCP